MVDPVVPALAALEAASRVLWGGGLIAFPTETFYGLGANALDGPDLQHSEAEARFLRLGQAADGRVLMVAYTLRRNGNAETIRLISARRASRRERAAYGAKD